MIMMTTTTIMTTTSAAAAASAAAERTSVFGHRKVGFRRRISAIETSDFGHRKVGFRPSKTTIGNGGGGGGRERRRPAAIDPSRARLPPRARWSRHPAGHVPSPSVHVPRTVVTVCHAPDRSCPSSVTSPDRSCPPVDTSLASHVLGRPRPWSVTSPRTDGGRGRYNPAGRPSPGDVIGQGGGMMRCKDPVPFEGYVSYTYV